MLRFSVAKLDKKLSFGSEIFESIYAKEIWALYSRGLLSVDTLSKGHFKQNTKPVDLKRVIRVIDAARNEEEARRIRIAEAGATGLR